MKTTAFTVLISAFLFPVFLTNSSFRKPDFKPKTTDRLADMDHFLDGSATSISAINSIGEGGIAYCIVPEETAQDNGNAYWFTNYENLVNWLNGKSYKDSVLKDIYIMDSLSVTLDDEHLNENRHYKKTNSLWGLNYANAYQNSNGTGTSHSYFYWHKTFYSFNNQASQVQMNAPGVLGFCTFCTQTKFRGSRFIISALFVNTKDLTGTPYDDNFESVF